MNEIFVGIDPSLSATGIVILDRLGKIIKQEEISTKKDSNNQYDIESRIYKICGIINNILSNYDKIQCVYIEEISFGSSGADSAQLAALNYSIRIELLKLDIPFYTIPPTTLKKYITGNGQFKKNMMLKEVYKKWGMDFNSDNLCDAYSLARMLLDNYNKGFFEIIKKKKEPKKRKIKVVVV